MSSWRWVRTAGGAVGVSPSADGRAVWIRVDRGGVMTPDEARELALELVAAAERIDPQPPPRPRRESGRGRGR